MPNTYTLEPPELNDYYQEFRQQLCDLIRTDNVDGRLSVAGVAKFLGMTVENLRRAIQSGRVPFAFSSGSSGREISYISTFAFCNWVMQSRPFLIETNAEKVENATREGTAAKGQSYIAKGIANRKWDAKERLVTR